MMISVASGKGGTGKTLVAVNLAYALSEHTSVQLVDADVEEPNVHIFLESSGGEKENEALVMIPEIDEEKCTFCGQCAQACNFNALLVGEGRTLVFPELCHGCGTCAFVCPHDAITEGARDIGVIRYGQAGENLSYLYGILNPGEAMAPPLTKQVKNRIAERKNQIVIIDSPPGTSCPVVQAVKGSDLCLLVAEPTPFGISNFKDTLKLMRMLAIPVQVVINRADYGDETLLGYCRDNDVDVLAELPFDRELAQVQGRGIPAVKRLPFWKDQFRRLAAGVLRKAGIQRGQNAE